MRTDIIGHRQTRAIIGRLSEPAIACHTSRASFGLALPASGQRPLAIRAANPEPRLPSCHPHKLRFD
jgi:hypothetical protein